MEGLDFGALRHHVISHGLSARPLHRLERSSPGIFPYELTGQHGISKPSLSWRRGREAEGGGLLNRYTVKSRIEGSNPSVSAND